MLRDALDGLAVHRGRSALIDFAVASEDVFDPRLASEPCEHARLDGRVVRHHKALIVMQRRYAVAQ